MCEVPLYGVSRPPRARRAAHDTNPRIVSPLIHFTGDAHKFLGLIPVVALIFGIITYHDLYVMTTYLII